MSRYVWICKLVLSYYKKSWYISFNSYCNYCWYFWAVPNFTFYFLTYTCFIIKEVILIDKKINLIIYIQANFPTLQIFFYNWSIKFDHFTKFCLFKFECFYILKISLQILNFVVWSSFIVCIQVAQIKLRYKNCLK